MKVINGCLSFYKEIDKTVCKITEEQINQINVIELNELSYYI